MPYPVLSRTILWLLALAQGAAGAWALGAPRSFFDDFPSGGLQWVAVLPPYNEHLTRDVGSLSLALVVLTVAAAILLERRLVAVVALAWLVYGAPHLVFHLFNLEGVGTAEAVSQVVVLSLGVLAPLVLLALATGRVSRRAAASG